jgi:uncharacterized membrane protein YdbT with pleckstrin-like domain
MNDIRLKAGGNISEKKRKEKKQNQDKTRAKKPHGDQTRTFSFANEVDPFFMNNFFELVRGFNFSDGLVWLYSGGAEKTQTQQHVVVLLAVCAVARQVTHDDKIEAKIWKYKSVVHLRVVVSFMLIISCLFHFFFFVLFFKF